MLREGNVKRLGIFFFFDQDGIVDKYVTYLLDDLVKSLDRLVIVCNGKLTSAGRKVFLEYTSDLIVRENEGLDVWAYKTAMDYLGWSVLETFDETVLLNNTIMGPVYPLEEMFCDMDQKDVDFWGITKYGQEGFDPFGCNPYGYIPEHIQSHFMVFRKKMVSSAEFQAYWDNMPPIRNYKESVGMHESVFTKKFADLGFKWDVYVNSDEYSALTTFPLIFYPKELIEKNHCPIFKRRQFFQEYDYVLANTLGQAASDLYKYLRSTGLYDVNLIWDNVLRTCHQADLVRNLHLNYILSTSNAHREKIDLFLKEKKIALVMHLYFEDMIEESFLWASAMPETADVYITTNTEKKKKMIETVFKKMNCHHLEVRVIENRGRDVSSLLVGVKDVIGNYEIACFVHDKKTAQINPGSVGNSFAYKCLKNTLYNKEFVYNVIETFEENPRLGILSPPMPNHGDYFPLVGIEWGLNFEVTQKLAQELKITVPMAADKEPIAPLGTCFWFRPKAMEVLFKKNWNYEDFPPEPNAIDGTLLHAVERIYPYAAQQAGYYPGFLMADDCAEIEYTNLIYYVRGYNVTLEKTGICGYYHDMRDAIKYAKEEKDVLKPEVQRLRDQSDSLGEQSNALRLQNNALLRENEHLQQLVADLYPKTSLKWQIKDRLKKLIRGK